MMKTFRYIVCVALGTTIGSIRCNGQWDMFSDVASSIYGEIDTTWTVSPITAIDTITLPSRAVGKPVLFQDEEMSYQWETRAQQRNFGSMTSDQLWQVYIDRDSVHAYAGPSRNSEVVKTFSFMNERDVLYIAAIQGDFALLYSEKREHANGLNISQHARPQGWVHLDELLLWSSCPRTVNQVYQKAFVLKEAKDVIVNHNFSNTSPEFSSSPVMHMGTRRRVTDLENYFVYKTVNGAALLFPDSKLNNNIYTSKMGWMASGLYTLWTDRLCYEPNFGAQTSGEVVNVYVNPEEAVVFHDEGVTDQDSAYLSKCIWTTTTSHERWSSGKTRLPVLAKVGDNKVSEVAVASTYSIPASEKASFAKRIDELRAKIAEQQKIYSRINVAFVIDGTPSMRKYYQPVANSIAHAMAQKEMQGSNIFFGAVVYRDYADEKSGRMVEVLPLTEDYKKAMTWLTQRECRTAGKKKSGAVYMGINTALEKMGWSRDNCNFIVLVGDIANDPDDQRVSAVQVMQKMAEYKVNFIAFQANHPNRPEYHNFSWQVQKIMLTELRALTQKPITRKNFTLNNQVYTYRNEDYEIISACFRFAEIDRNESPDNLQDLIEDRIIDFKRQVNENLVILQTVLEGLNDEYGDTQFSKAAIDFLNRRGLSADDIHLLKQQNVTLKVRAYTSNLAQDREILIPSIFISQQELNLLIKGITNALRIMDYNGDDRRANVRDALNYLAEIYLGPAAGFHDMLLGELFVKMSGMSTGYSHSTLANYMVDELMDPSLVSETQLTRFIKELHIDLDRLVTLRENNRYYFDSANGLRYYYLLLDDMPFMLSEYNEEINVNRDVVGGEEEDVEEAEFEDDTEGYDEGYDDGDEMFIEDDLSIPTDEDLNVPEESAPKSTTTTEVPEEDIMDLEDDF